MKIWLLIDWEMDPAYRKVVVETEKEAYAKILKLYCEEFPEEMVNLLIDHFGTDIIKLDEVEELQ